MNPEDDTKNNEQTSVPMANQILWKEPNVSGFPCYMRSLMGRPASLIWCAPSLWSPHCPCSEVLSIVCGCNEHVLMNAQWNGHSLDPPGKQEMARVARGRGSGIAKEPSDVCTREVHNCKAAIVCTSLCNSLWRMPYRAEGSCFTLLVCFGVRGFAVCISYIV